MLGVKNIKTLFASIISYVRYSVLLNDPKLDRKSKNVFFLMNSVYFGFFISTLYGFVTALITYFFARDTFERYIYDFFIGYNCFITGGLLFGLAFQIYKTQDYIPNLLSKVFGEERLLENKTYYRHRKTFFSIRSSNFIVSRLNRTLLVSFLFVNDGKINSIEFVASNSIEISVFTR